MRKQYRVKNGVDAVRVTDDHDKISICDFYGDCSDDAHNDFIQIIPKRSGGGFNTQFSCALISGISISSNTFTSKGKWQSIFCSDGLVRDISIFNNIFNTPNANHFISLNGVLSGNFSKNINNVGDAVRVHLGNARIGGNASGRRNVWVLSFSDSQYIYQEVSCKNLNDERGKAIKHSPDDIFLYNFDLDGFIRKAEGLKPIDLQDMALSFGTQEPLADNKIIKRGCMTTLSEASRKLGISTYLILAVRSKEKGHSNSILFERHIFVKELIKKGVMKASDWSIVSPESTRFKDYSSYKKKMSMESTYSSYLEYLKEQGIYVPNILSENGDNWTLLKPEPYSSSGKKYDSYGKFSDQEKRFSLARLIDDECAHLSCSWSSMQVMGFNYDHLGFDSVYDLVECASDEYELFVRYMINNQRALNALKDCDFKVFSKYYNGAKSKKKYASDISKEYRRLVAKGNERKPIHKSQTQIANAAEAVIKTGGTLGGGTLAMDSYEKFNNSIIAVQASLERAKELKTSLKKVKSTVEDLGVNIDNLIDVSTKPDYLQYGILGLICVFLVIPNLRILHRYSVDNGYI